MHFASDNSGPIHPKVMAALAAANEGYALPYGNDDWTHRAVALVRDVFEAPEAAVYFTATGTSVNAILLACLAQPYQTVFCTPEAHIHVDECNAPEFYTGGAKLTLIESTDAKMNSVALASSIAELAGGGVHGPQAGVVSLTQVTERGTLYTLAELKALTDIAKSHAMPVHLDGARFANAMVALGCSAADMSWRLGIDAVSFGGTKNGLMGVEAAVIFDPAKAWEFELRRKRGGHLFSKNRYLAAQMVGYLTDGLWLDMARASNAAGQSLVNALRQIDSVAFAHEPQANMLYCTFPQAAHRRLQAAGAEYSPQSSLEVAADTPVLARMVPDWSCRAEDIAEFAAHLAGNPT